MAHFHAVVWMDHFFDEAARAFEGVHRMFSPGA